MKNSRFFSTAFLCATCCVTGLHAQSQPTAPVAPIVPSAATATASPQTPEEFFSRARQLNDPEAAGIPFHMKTTFVASGDTEFTGNGTYEEWWQSKDIWRKEATLGDYKYIAIQNGEKSVASATSVYMPLRVWQAMELQLFHIGLPKEKQGEWELSTITRTHDTLEEVAKQQPCSPQEKGTLCIQQYEFAENGVLQSYRQNDVSEIYSNPQSFGKLWIPRNITTTLQESPILIMDIALLEPLQLGKQNLFSTPLIADSHVIPARITDMHAVGLTLPKLIHKSRIKYPKSERKSHLTPTVVIQGQIDTNGIVREPYVALSGGTPFDNAAMQELSKWRFKPAMQNGQPIEVDFAFIISNRIF